MRYSQMKPTGGALTEETDTTAHDRLPSLLEGVVYDSRGGTEFAALPHLRSEVEPVERARNAAPLRSSIPIAR